jgi:superfamily II DNA or RNA helicase
VGMSALVDQGYLLKQHIELVIISKPKGYEKWGWGQELQRLLIHENGYRNNLIVEKAIEKVEAGLKVLILTSRLKHIQELSKLLEAKHAKHAIVIGNSSRSARQRRIDWLTQGKVKIIVGTIFGEGVDVPAVECAINAEGGSDIKKTIQRMRNMTVADGKTIAVFIDFMDVTNKYFAKHSKERLAVYKEENSFAIKIIRPNTKT